MNPTNWTHKNPDPFPFLYYSLNKYIVFFLSFALKTQAFSNYFASFSCVDSSTKSKEDSGVFFPRCHCGFLWAKTVDYQINKIRKISESLSWSDVNRRKWCCFENCSGLTVLTMSQYDSRICCESCFRLTANRETVEEGFSPGYTNTLTCVWPQCLARSQSVPRGCCHGENSVVVQQVWAFCWISVDEEAARSHSLINNDPGVCT